MKKYLISQELSELIKEVLTIRTREKIALKNECSLSLVTNIIDRRTYVREKTQPIVDDLKSELKSEIRRLSKKVKTI